MKIAAVHMDTVFADVKTNMRNVYEKIKQAKEKEAELIVFPEFFTTGFAFSDKLYDSVLKNDNPQKLLNEYAKEFNIIIGGSYLELKYGDVYNTFTLTFPDETVYRHSKDIPTLYEHFIYNEGDNERVFETPIGNIGVALCWEQIRYKTLKEMAGNVDIILSGSCWWSFSENDLPELQNLNATSNEMAVNAPIEIAKRLHVPVIHSSHNAIFNGVTFPDKAKEDSRIVLGATEIIDKNGDVLSKINYDEKSGIIIEDINYNIEDRPNTKIYSDKYWIPEMPEIFLYGWDKMMPKMKEYYNKVSKPMFIKK